MEQIALTVFTGILIAAVTSWITVQLSLKRFRTEKWWERKADAYTEILDALHDAKKFSDEHLRAEYKDVEVSKERDEELRTKSKDSREELMRAVDTGAFLLCDEAVQILQKYESDIDSYDDCPNWFEYIDGQNTINHRTLKELILVARKDLKQ